MNISYHTLILLLLILSSCADSSKEIKTEDRILSKIDSLHSNFNEVELTKRYYDFEEDTIRIVAFGHVYSLLFHEDVMDEFIKTVNDQHPDYVWILGDIVYNNAPEEWEYLNRKYKDIEGIRLHAGGNHDMNFHYERYFGIRENQWVAESRYLENIGYRYLTLEDNLSNYMLINMNDSLDRIEEYLSKMSPEMNPNKPSILFTHHCTWHDTMSKADDPKTWVKKSFNYKDILSKIRGFDHLIHGDWSQQFYRGVYSKGKGKGRFDVIGVGNLNEGDPLFLTNIKITKDTLIANPIYISIPDQNTWGEVRKK